MGGEPADSQPPFPLLQSDSDVIEAGLRPLIEPLLAPKPSPDHRLCRNCFAWLAPRGIAPHANSRACSTSRVTFLERCRLAQQQALQVVSAAMTQPAGSVGGPAGGGGGRPARQNAGNRLPDMLRRRDDQQQQDQQLHEAPLLLLQQQCVHAWEVSQLQGAASSPTDEIDSAAGLSDSGPEVELLSEEERDMQQWAATLAVCTHRLARHAQLLQAPADGGPVHSNASLGVQLVSKLV